MNRRIFLVVIASLCALPALALYDPPPEAALSSIQGEWRGSLTYLDYSQTNRLVTLPAKLFIALSTPNELVLHYVFDDGPTKTVFSYERMDFDFAKHQLTWTSGLSEKSKHVYRLTASREDGSTRKLMFERKDGKTIDRFEMELDPRSFRLKKNEVDAAGAITLRNKFEFTRPGK